MHHPYRIREIAQQAGLSEATVDRVLHGRTGVRASTAAEVRQAIADLDRQRSQLRISGRTFLVDVVMQAPRRFSTAVRDALEAELPSLRPAVVRSRWHLTEKAPVADLAGRLDGIRRRGAQGVLVKAPDRPEVTEAVDRLAAAGIPVVTLVTDLPASRRVAYVGIDNRAAGATAAYLIAQWLGNRSGSVLVTLSSEDFRGEEEREMGFRAALRRLGPRPVVEIPDSDGLDATIGGPVRDALAADPGIQAVYSIGGGNVAILDAFVAAGRACEVFVAHDLDADNTRLLRDGRVSVVLHHDLRADVRRACQVIMQAQGALPGPVLSVPSSIHVVTPYNVPSAR